VPTEPDELRAAGVAAVRPAGNEKGDFVKQRALAALEVIGGGAAVRALPEVGVGKHGSLGG